MQKEAIFRKRSPQDASARSRLNKERSAALPYVLISPLILFIGVLALYPTVRTLVESFFGVDPLNPQGFVGLQNYVSVFTNPAVIYSWVNTFLYMAFGTGLSTLVAVLVALGLRVNFRGRAVVLAILILPWALPAITEGIIWAWIYDPSFGVLNSILHSLHLISHYQLWISGNRILTVFLIELVQVWQMTPLSIILILAGLQSIPDELYEAARVDGAGLWRTTFTISLPLVRPSIAVAVVQSLVASLNVFDQVYVLNANATTGSSIMLQTYNITFQNLNFGQGYALSFIAVLITMAIALGLLKITYRRVEF
ncbi:MAG: carbohydrate ABC transporter permease [Bacilli bacterium]